MRNQAVSELGSVRPLSGGFYTVSEVSRILGLGSTAVVNNWLGGGKSAPTIVRQYSETKDVGFWDLIEIRFINYFRKQGVSLQHLRKAANKARERFSVTHPFALSDVKFKTDRKKIFADIGSEDGIKELEEMTTGQLSFYEIVEDFLAKGVEFDPSSGLARRWMPEPESHPNIILDPKVSHGQPSVMMFKVPTKALFLNWRAEQFSYSATSDWFEIDEERVREAVDYELGLDI